MLCFIHVPTLCSPLTLSSSTLINPLDPHRWTDEQVLIWAEWAKKEFNLSSLELRQLRGATGPQICCFGTSDFTRLAYVKEHGITLQNFLERIKTGS